MPNLRGLSVIQRLSISLGDSGSSIQAREQVILRALSLISHLHDGLLAQNDSEKGGYSKSTESLIDPTTRRTIFGLLDLVSIEGIHPSLSPNVGLPLELRVKSALSGAGTTSQNVNIDQVTLRESLLPRVLEKLLPILLESSRGLGPWLRDRIFVDVLASAFELAFNPDIPEKSKNKYQDSLESLINGYDTWTYFTCLFHGTCHIELSNIDNLKFRSSISTLFPALTSLLRPDAPVWLRPHVSRVLSLLPVRSSGVRQTIEFIASRSPGATLPEERPNKGNEKTTGPRIHLDSLTQAARLLSSVPSSLTAMEYYSTIAPQLFALLDGDAGSDMSRVAGYIMGKGILSRMQSGAPGTAGWKIFAGPMLSKIDPEQSPKRPEPSTSLGTIVSEYELDQAITRMTTLFHSHPNPALARRLLGVVILPLWALLAYSKGTGKSQWYERARTLLYMYYSIAADPQALKLLSVKLMYDGGESWVFAPGGEGGVETRRRVQTSEESRDVMDVLSSLDSRIDEFLQLAASDSISDSSIGPVFTSVTQEWLGTSHLEDENHIREVSSSDKVKDPLKALVNARLLQGMLDKLKEKLAKSPTQILEFVKELLKDFVTDLKHNAELEKQNKNPTYHGLGRIVKEDMDVEKELENEPFEVVSVAISLLSAVVSSPQFQPSTVDSDLISSIQELFGSRILSKSILPADLSLAISNIRGLLELYTSAAAHGQQSSEAVKDVILEDRKAFSLSQTYITDSLPPVRAQGLTVLQALIKKQSPVIDIHATTTLILSILQDTEEYIYLFAIRILALLASKHPKSVIRMLTQSYLDKDETMDLDQRLRLGEALERIVESSGAVFGGDVAQAVGKTCLEIAGRRGQRPKFAAAAEKNAKLQQQKQKEAEQAWGGEVSSIEPEDDKLAERLADTLKGWEGKDGEEDVRIRTSALSILATAIETNLRSVGPEVASAGLDIAIAILTLETSDEKAILRRAAVLVISSLLKALDRAEEEGQDVGFRFAGARLEDISRVIQYVEATDSDDLVKGHARTVLEGLNNWRIKALIGDQTRHQNESSMPAGFSGHLAGLSVRPDFDVATKRIEEIE